MKSKAISMYNLLKRKEKERDNQEKGKEIAEDIIE